MDPNGDRHRPTATLVTTIAILALVGLVPGLTTATADATTEVTDRRAEGTELGLWFLDDDDELLEGHTRDSSGNGLHLTTAGDPPLVDSPQPDFREGYQLNESRETRLERSGVDEQLEVAGDLSLFIAFSVDEVSVQDPKHGLIAEGDSAGGVREQAFSLFFHDDGFLGYRHTAQHGEIELKSSQQVDEGFHTVWLVRNTTTNEVKISLDGNPPDTFVYGLGNDPIETDPAEFQVGHLKNTGPVRTVYRGPLDGAVFEARVWDRTVDSDVLDNISADGRPHGPAPHPGCEERIERPLVSGCLDATDVVLEQVAPDIDISENETAGHLDRYAFDAGGPTVVLTCIALQDGDQTIDPCAEAGGQARERVATLVEEETPRVSPAQQTIRVCEGTASLVTTLGGVEDLPVLMPCNGV